MLAWITTNNYQRKTVNVERHIEVTIIGKYMGFVELHLSTGEVINDAKNITYVNKSPVIEKTQKHSLQ